MDWWRLGRSDRRAPLSEYLLRARYCGLADRAEEVNRLQKSISTVVPVECVHGFRVWIQPKLVAAGNAPVNSVQEVLRALEKGLYVFRVRYDREAQKGAIWGFTHEPPLRIQLVFPACDFRPETWKLVRAESKKMRSRLAPRLAELRATWIPQPAPAPADRKAGDAKGCAEAIRERERQWLSGWKPPVVVGGTQGLHLSKKFRESDPRAKEIFEILCSRSPELHIVRIAGQTWDNDPNCFRNWLKSLEWGFGQVSLNQKLSLYAYLEPLKEGVVLSPAPFAPEAGHWLLYDRFSKLPAFPVVARLRVQWRSGSPEFYQYPMEWLHELATALASFGSYCRGWEPLELGSDQYFRLGAKPQTLPAGWTLEGLLQKMSEGLHFYPPSGSHTQLVARFADSSGLVVIRPQEIYMCDWRLHSIEPRHGTEPAFALLRASWEVASPRSVPTGASAPRVLAELEALHEARQNTAIELSQVINSLGTVPELPERLAQWRRVTDWERQLVEVGIAAFHKGDNDWVLMPAREDRFVEWWEELEQINPQGIPWERNSLRLRYEGREIALRIISIQEKLDLFAPRKRSILVHVVPSNPAHASLLEEWVRLIESDPSVVDSAELFLPESQVRAIYDAIDLVDPDSGKQNQERGSLRDSPEVDELSLITLRTLFANPRQLKPIEEDWPPLPRPPLVPLSDAQEWAVRAAVFTPDVVLIQGPPGTGKTTVILEILRQLFYLHQEQVDFRVLLVAPTHVAVDNVLERLLGGTAAGNYLFELGLIPFRVGATRRIPEHLRGFTPDCVNTEYCQRVEKELSLELERLNQEAAKWIKLEKCIRDAIIEEKRNWARALKEGILSEFESLCRQEDLDLPQGVDLRDARSRFQAWLQLRERSAVEQTKRFLSDWLEFLRQNPSFFSELLCGGGNVVCGTTVGCVTHPGLRSAVYDYAIIDEAGKEETRRILIPMVRARRWILVGDHQQLPPFADDRLQRRIREEGMDPELIFRSLFEELQPVLAQKGRFVFLDRQGRMHPEISAFVSMQFYGGQLKDFPNVSQHNLPAPSFLEACLGRVPHIVVLDTQDLPDRYEKREGFGYLNPLEVRLVVVLLEAYAKLPGFRAEATHRDPPTIGVIAPYRHQVKELERRILRSSSLRYLLEMGQLQIGTVDSFQGQEKDLVIFSTTRSNPEGRLGFVDNRQRLNVAFSRARAQLVVIMDGSTVLLARQRGDSRDLEAEIRDHLYALWEYAAKIGGWVRLDSQHLAGFQGLSL